MCEASSEFCLYTGLPQGLTQRGHVDGLLLENPQQLLKRDFRKLNKWQQQIDLRIRFMMVHERSGMKQQV